MAIFRQLTRGFRQLDTARPLASSTARFSANVFRAMVGKRSGTLGPGGGSRARRSQGYGEMMRRAAVACVKAVAVLAKIDNELKILWTYCRAVFGHWWVTARGAISTWSSLPRPSTTRDRNTLAAVGICFTWNLFHIDANKDWGHNGSRFWSPRRESPS